MEKKTKQQLKKRLAEIVDKIKIAMAAEDIAMLDILNNEYQKIDKQLKELKK